MSEVIKIPEVRAFVNVRADETLWGRLMMRNLELLNERRVKGWLFRGVWVGAEDFHEGTVLFELAEGVGELGVIAMTG